MISRTTIALACGSNRWGKYPRTASVALARSQRGVTLIELMIGIAIGLLTIAAMSVFASVGAFLLYTGVIRELGLIRSNVFTNLIPVFTVFLAFFILGERLSLRGAAGVTLTVLGLLISQSHDLRQLRRKRLSKNLSQSGM